MSGAPCALVYTESAYEPLTRWSHPAIITLSYSRCRASSESPRFVREVLHPMGRNVRVHKRRLKPRRRAAGALLGGLRLRLLPRRRRRSGGRSGLRLARRPLRLGGRRLLRRRRPLRLGRLLCRRGRLGRRLGRGLLGLLLYGVLDLQPPLRGQVVPLLVAIAIGHVVNALAVFLARFVDHAHKPAALSRPVDLDVGAERDVARVVLLPVNLLGLRGPLGHMYVCIAEFWIWLVGSCQCVCVCVS